MDEIETNDIRVVCLIKRFFPNLGEA